jgi:hypothetical protein
VGFRPGPAYTLAAEIAHPGVHPSLFMVGAAVGDSLAWLTSMHHAFSKLDMVVSHLDLFPCRSTATLVNDPAHRRVLALFAGVSSKTDEMWSWDGSTGTHVSTPVTPPYDPITTSVAYDPQSGDVVLYATGDVGTTWALDGNTWHEVNRDSPIVDTDYHGAMLLTDTRVGSVIMLGTAKRPNPLNALWIYTGIGWYAMKASVPSSATASGPPHATAET